MKGKQYNLICKILIFGLLLLLVNSCSKKETITDSKHNQVKERGSTNQANQLRGEGKKNQENKTNYGTWQGFDGPTVAYSRLDDQIFTDILTDNINISDVYIIYLDRSREDENGNPLEDRDLDIEGGYSWKSMIYSDINSFEGSYNHYIEGVTQQDDPPLIHNFTKVEIDVLFNYLKQDDNPSYFFNGSELAGKPDPFESPSYILCDGKYTFALLFGKPNDSRYAWGICKCCDDPSTDKVFLELISLIEDNFLSHF